MKLGYLIREAGGSTPSKANPEFWDGDIPWVSPKDMKVDLLADSQDHVTEQAVRDSSLRLIPPGSILMVVRGMILAHTVPIAETMAPVTLNQDMKALLPSRRVWPRFLRYSMKAAQRDLLALVEVAGHGTRCLRSEQWRKYEIGVPPLPTQRAIADFLDRKTAAIDSVIEKKERLIALLAEKRAALIHQVVTKGLDAGVQMKDSGVPWIGEIPVHWEVKRLKNVCSFITSGPRGWGQYYSDEGPLFLRITNVPRDGVDLLLQADKRQSVSPPEGAEGVRTLAVPGDVLVTITADLGSVGVVPDGLGETYISQHVAMCRPSEGLLPRLIAYVVRSAWGRVHYELSMNGGTKVGLTLDDVRNTPLVVPPANVQEEVLDRIDTASARLADTQRTLANQLDKLREYRQALITTAVTGQLDITAEDTAPAEPQLPLFPQQATP